MKVLPIVISIPHGGIEIPVYMKDNLILDQLSLMYDGDTWTEHLYHFEARVLHTALMPVARAVLDVNRLKSFLPPHEQDGVVKTISTLNTPVWKRPLSVLDVEMLIKDYYDPYYQGLIEQTKRLKPLLGLDCHSMLATDPFDQSQPKRPLFCISNRGGFDGEFLDEPITAPAAYMQAFKHQLEAVFGFGTVQINQPFKGGALIQQMHALTNIPWIQLEINRQLYVPDKETLTLMPEGPWLMQILVLKEQLFNALEMFIETIKQKKIL